MKVGVLQEIQDALVEEVNTQPDFVNTHAEALAAMVEKLGDVASSFNDHIHSDGSIVHMREDVARLLAIGVRWLQRFEDLK